MKEIEKAYEARLRQDHQTALKIFIELASQGDPEAQWQLGQHYEQGLGVIKDQTEAMNWMQKAADNGLSFARTWIGYQYEHGQGGVKKNYEEALKWYRRSAELGDQEAPYYIGQMYEEGRGVTKDVEESLKWYYKSALVDFPEAFIKISNMYESGVGLKQDHVQAYVWLSVSRSQDIHWINQKLSSLDKKMSSQQIGEAKQLVATWKPTNIPTIISKP